MRRVWRWLLRTSTPAAVAAVMAFGCGGGLLLAGELMGALWAVLTSFWAFYTWHAERELRRQAPEAFLGKIVLHLNGESMIHTDANGTRHIITAYKDTHHGR